MKRESIYAIAVSGVISIVLLSIALFPKTTNLIAANNFLTGACTDGIVVDKVCTRANNGFIPIETANVILKVGQEMISQGQSMYGGAPDNSTNMQSSILPVTVTYTLNFTEPTRAFDLYPIDTASWEGAVNEYRDYSIVDSNGTKVPIGGGGQRDYLGIVRVNCTEPHYAKFDIDNGGGVITAIERTSSVTPSDIPWGSALSVAFGSSNATVNENPRTIPSSSEYVAKRGIFYLIDAGAGIKPANSTKEGDIYHLSFATFYNNTIVQLPKSSVTQSYQKETCKMAKLPMPNTGAILPQHLFSHVYVYDIRFAIPNMHNDLVLGQQTSSDVWRAIRNNNATESEMIQEAQVSPLVKAFMLKHPDAQISVERLPSSIEGSYEIKFVKNLHWVAYYTSSGYLINPDNPLIYNNTLTSPPPNSRPVFVSGAIVLSVRLISDNNYGQSRYITLECQSAVGGSGIGETVDMTGEPSTNETGFIQKIDTTECVS
jgi:hypothetical protein